MQRFLVARMDGTPASGFALGAIRPTQAVPVTLNFDVGTVIGKADITVEGESVYATLKEDYSLAILGDLYPALGGRGHTGRLLGDRAGEVFDLFEVVTVGLCTKPNMDAQIPPIGARP